MALALATASRNAAANAIADLADAGAGAGYIEFRTGASPGPNSAATGTLLATCALSDPAFGNAAAGVVTANAISSDVSVDAGGTPGYFRIYDSDANAICDGTVTISAGGGDIEFDSVTWLLGATAAMTSLTITVPQ